jgi:hypothetical protein
MKLAFARTGAPHRHAHWNVASFSAKRLSLVEQPQMNGLNKELKRLPQIPRRFLNPSLTIPDPAVGLAARNADQLAQRAQEFARARQGAHMGSENERSEEILVRFDRTGS